MPMVQKKSESVVKSGEYQQYYLEKQMSKSLDIQPTHVDHKAERREERRRKATSGKGGGGTQGRETKTKAVKKHSRSSKHTAQHSDSDDDVVVTKKSQKPLEIVSVEDIENIIRTDLENEGLDDLVTQIAEYLQGLVYIINIIIIIKLDLSCLVSLFLCLYMFTNLVSSKLVTSCLAIDK